MLIHAHMPNHYWAEALSTVTYLQNLRPSTAIANSVPYELLFRQSLSYDHLQVLGCLCYPNLSTTAPHKLAPRSAACMFLGYPSSHKGYRCLDIASRRVIISRHIVFDETSFPFSACSFSACSSSAPTESYDFLLDDHDLQGPLVPPPVTPPVPAPSSMDVEQARPFSTAAPSFTDVKQPRPHQDSSPPSSTGGSTPRVPDGPAPGPTSGPAPRVPDGPALGLSGGSASAPAAPVPSARPAPVLQPVRATTRAHVPTVSVPLPLGVPGPVPRPAPGPHTMQTRAKADISKP